MKKPELLTQFKELVEKDKQLRLIQIELDRLRSQKNTLSQEINILKKAGKNIDAVLKKMKELPEEVKKKEEEYTAFQERVTELLHTLPNIIHDKVPYGKSDKDNVEIKKWGKIPKFSFPVKTHVEILEALDAVDFDASARATGNGFYYLKGDFALLNQALIHFVQDYMVKKKYTYIEPPLMLKKDLLFKSIDAKSFEQSVYSIEGEDTALIGTSEFSMLTMYFDRIIDLPKKYFSYTMCFRREVGAHGINEKGLWRTHQFNKVEQFIFCKPEESWKFYDELLKNTEEVFQALELPYHVIELCTGDLSVWKARSADIEVWRPTTQAYGEVASLSNCTDYQARSLNIRYEEKGERKVVHTLNNTAIATSRALVAIVEHYQQKDGSIAIPKVLQKYMSGKKVITKSS
ncbi:MAG TPA: serine--tRNA ligase [Nanoarchaeota archaeon]|nr:serine--tRNA ligase [Nanoarchaeota archaeon]